MKVLYVFRERKQPLIDAWRAGREPDTLLFGLNHLPAVDIQPDFHEPTYGPLGRATARQVGRLGPDFLQLRALGRFREADVVLLTAGWPLLLLARRFLRRPPALIWLNLSLTTLLSGTLGGRAGQGGGRGAQHAGAPWPERLRSRLLRTAVGSADRIVCVARSQQAPLRRELGLSLDRLPVVPSGVDAAFYTPDAKSSAGVVLAAGRDAGRDYATFARAVTGLGRAARIVAGPSNLAGVRLPSNVSVQLSIPPLALREEYRSAACVAVPTHGDGHPVGSDCSGTLVTLDAMACGRPVVVTHRRSMDDYVSLADPEVLTVPPGDPTAMRAAIDRVLQSPGLAADLGARGRAAVEARFNTRAMAAQLAAVFRDAVRDAR